MCCKFVSAQDTSGNFFCIDVFLYAFKSNENFVPLRKPVFYTIVPTECFNSQIAFTGEWGACPALTLPPCVQCHLCSATRLESLAMSFLQGEDRAKPPPERACRFSVSCTASSVSRSDRLLDPYSIHLPPPKHAPTLGERRIILSDPRGWALNWAVGPIDVPLCLAIIQWALWVSVWGLGGGWAFVRAWAVVVGGCHLFGEEGLANNRPSACFQPQPPL